MFDIRPEKPTDIEAVYEVNKLAFGRADEADLVNVIRNHEKNLVSLVASDGDKVAGHIQFSPMTVEGQPQNKAVIGLAPWQSYPHIRTGE